MARSPITISTDRTTRGNLLPHLARSPRSVDSFFYTIGTPANWVVTSPTGGFSRQISENPRRDRWPSLEHSRTSEVAEREREREEGEGGRRDTRRASHRRDEDGERWNIRGGKETSGQRYEGNTFHIDTLSCSSYPLAISCRISPSRLIELLVYTYTTHNDSSERERDRLRWVVSLSLSRSVIFHSTIFIPSISNAPPLVFPDLPSFLPFFFYCYHYLHLISTFPPIQNLLYSEIDEDLNAAILSGYPECVQHWQSLPARFIVM